MLFDAFFQIGVNPADCCLPQRFKVFAGASAPLVTRDVTAEIAAAVKAVVGSIKLPLPLIIIPVGAGT